MKKFTLLIPFLTLFSFSSHAQCIDPESDQYPSDTVVSENLGFVQEIETCIFASEHTRISNILIGEDYVFSMADSNDDTQRYVTVTDLDDNAIAFGPSPLTVEDITVAEIKVYYSENAECENADGCHTNTIQILLTCPPPVGINVSGVTTTNATFTWEPGSETEWEVLVLEASLPAPTSTTDGTEVQNNPEFSATTLQSATEYTFYVRANCGSEFSPWNRLNFFSACDPVNSFVQNFDSTEYPDLPICWTSLVGGEGVSEDAYVQTLEYNGTNDSHSVEIYRSESGPDANVILVSPALGNLSLGTHRLKFSSYAYDPADFEIGTLDGTTADATFTLYEGLEIEAQNNEYAIDFTGYTGTDTYIGLRMVSGYSVFLDDIRWEVAPLCPDVSGVAFSNTTPNSATIVWNPGGDETEWDIAYGAPTLIDPSGLTPITPSSTGTPEGTISGLEPGTTHNVWVRSVCGENDGAWIGPITVTTDCLPTASFNENFDTTEYLELPDCWSSIIRGEQLTQYDRVGTYDSEAHSAPNSLMIARDYLSTESILVSPNLSNLGAGTHRIKFYGLSYADDPKIEIGTLNSTSDLAEFSLIEEVELTDSHQEYVVDFTIYEGTDTYIGFKLNSGYSVYLDDIRWEISPLCADVTEIALTDVATTTASLAWAAGNSETQWDIVYATAEVTDPSTLTPVTPAPSGIPEAQITALQPATDYKAWVRSVCGTPNGDGAWIGPIAFTTACLPAAVFNENFDTTEYGSLPSCWSTIIRGEDAPSSANIYAVDNNVYSEPNAVRLGIYNINETADIDVILVSPNLSTLATGTHRIKFYGYGYITGALEVGTLDSSTQNANFSPWEEVEITSTYTEFVVDFTGYDGTDTYVGIRHKSGDYTFLDNIRWEVAPLCPDVQEIQISGTTTVATTVYWSPGGSETNWQVAYGASDVTDPDTLTPSAVLSNSNYTIGGLTQNTAYKVWVRSVCGGSDGNGIWMGPFAFNTQCNATEVPYTEDFEAAQEYSLPACTTSLNVGEGNDWTVLESPTDSFTSKTLAYEYNSDNPADTWFFTRGINLTAGTEYTISYRYGNSGNWTENLKVMYGTSADVDGMTEEIADHFEISTDSSETNLETFTPPTTGVYYFGFNAYSEVNQNLLLVDDIAVYNALGNDNFDASSFKFYPNPVKDMLNLSYIQNITNVAVYNLLGQKVVENTLNANATQVDMSNLSSGSYLVKVTADNQTKTIKIIKE